MLVMSSIERICDMFLSLVEERSTRCAQHQCQLQHQRQNQHQVEIASSPNIIANAVYLAEIL